MSMTLLSNDTATTPVTDRSEALKPCPINYNADWRVVSENPGETVLANIQAPLDKPERVKFAVSEIADVFKGGIIDGPGGEGLTSTTYSRKGVSVLVQLQTTGEDTDAGYRFPIQAHLVLKVPFGAVPSAANVQYAIERLLGHLFETGQVTTEDRIDALLRGALTPTDL